LKHYPHIIYGGSIAGLKDDLGKRIAYHLANPQEKPARAIAAGIHNRWKRHRTGCSH